MKRFLMNKFLVKSFLTKEIFKRSFLVIAFIGLTGCASYPNEVQVAEGTNLTAFELANEPNSETVGQTARWSGIIADVKNLKDKTRVDVLYYPAASNGRPKTDDQPVGRFRVYADKFLDPAVFKKGKSITALGPLKEKETAKIDEYEYEYPTIDDATVFLWPKQQPRANVEFYYGWHGYHPRWYWNGGVRHIYVVGKSGKKSAKKAKAN